MLSISRLFRKKPKKFYSSSAELFDSIVGEGTEVHGRIVARKSIRIDGSVYGSVEIPEGERNITVAIGVNGKVFGDIKSYRVLVAGAQRFNHHGKLFNRIPDLRLRVQGG